jgi:hypothetical protein
LVLFDLNPLWALVGLAVIGFFSGFGSAFGNYVFNEWWKPHILERIKKGLVVVKGGKEV